MPNEVKLIRSAIGCEERTTGAGWRGISRASRHINHLVYELYNLAEEEIAIVEGEVGK